MRRWWPLVATTLLLVAISLVAGESFTPISAAPSSGDLSATAASNASQPSPPPSAIATPSPTAGAASGSSWTEIGATLAGAALLIAAVFLLGRTLRASARFRRRRLRRRVPTNRPLATVAAEEEVLAALDAGLLELDDDTVDPRRVVIACWVRLEQSAAAAGVPRHAGDTPTDFVVRMLGRHRLSEPVLTAFAGVYRRARYATHEIDPTMRDQSQQALRRLRDELAVAGAAASAGHAPGAEQAMVGGPDRAGSPTPATAASRPGVRQ